MEHGKEPVPGLPDHLPPGENILWQGKPDWRRLAVCALHARKVAIFLVLMMVTRGAVDVSNGVTLAASAADLSGFAVLTVFAAGVLALIAWLFARSTLYTITNRRIVMRFGVAMPLSINLPHKKIDAVELRQRGRGTGDIALTTNTAAPLSYIVMWPHARPWRMAPVVPMLRCVPDAEQVARKMASAMRAGVAMQPTPATNAPARPIPDHDHSVSSLPIGVAAGFVLLSLVAVIVVKLGGGGQVIEPVVQAELAEYVDLYFEDQEGGHVAVIDANQDVTIEVLNPGDGNFMRATMRGLVRARKAVGAGPEEPFRVARTHSGRLLIIDSVTERQIDLWAFGQTNAEAFARLLASAEANVPIGPPASAVEISISRAMDTE